MTPEEVLAVQHPNRGKTTDVRWPEIGELGGVPIPAENGTFLADRRLIYLLWNDFPDVDVLAKLVRIRYHFKTHPSRRLPRAAVRGYIYRWFDRETDGRWK